jgi:hypothetical protein
MPPMRTAEAPVRANVTGTVSPTDRCLDVAVVESMSSSPWARAAELPAVMRRITVSARCPAETAVSVASALLTSNCDR